MALLYASKYKYNRSRGGGSVGDVERAEYYLKLASEYLGETYYLLNEIGLIYLEFYDPTDAEARKANYSEAERLFRESLRDKKEQQRAHYNLGVLATKRKDWEKATGHYADALRFTNWENDRREEMECNVVYNAACAWARIGDANKVVQYLRKAADFGFVEVKTVDRDYTVQEGDFFKFLRETDDHTKNELMELRNRLSSRIGEQAIAQTSGPTLWRRFGSAFRAFTADS